MEPPAASEENPMMFRRRNPFIPVVFVAAAVAILVAAALTSWWMLLALIPLAMMVGCMAMMMTTHPCMAGRPSAPPSGCCGMSAITAGPIGTRAQHSENTAASNG
jgi:hypothetical protein